MVRQIVFKVESILTDNIFMVKSLKRHIIFILFALVGFQMLAQQDPQFTQYMYNMSVINPAYAKDASDEISLGVFYRNQWTGSVGGPTTGTLFGHTTLYKNIEGGLSIVHDQIGDVVKETNVYADVAYVLQTGKTSKLSLGLKFGATFFSTNFDGFVYSDPLPDPAFAENISRTYPNVGVGAFFFGKNYYIGFSAPNLLKSKHLENNDGVVANGVEEIHMFLTGGYVFELNDQVKFKPAFMTKAVSGAPLSFDLTANFLWRERLELGAGYRFDDAISGLINFRVLSNLRIGYAYDYTLSNLGKFNNGSHEIMILFDISTLGKGYDKSPRFF